MRKMLSPSRHRSLSPNESAGRPCVMSPTAAMAPSSQAASREPRSREAVWQRIHPDDRDGVNENIEHGVREKRSFANEFRIILPDGTIKHIEATNDPVFSASGELLEIVVTGIDVTERRRAEQALRESEAKFRDYAETASDWFWEIGPDYKFT